MDVMFDVMIIGPVIVGLVVVGLALAYMLPGGRREPGEPEE